MSPLPLETPEGMMCVLAVLVGKLGGGPIAIRQADFDFARGLTLTEELAGPVYSLTLKETP